MMHLTGHHYCNLIQLNFVGDLNARPCNLYLVTCNSIKRVYEKFFEAFAFQPNS
jgi:hypothetical protein